VRIQRRSLDFDCRIRLAPFYIVLPFPFPIPLPPFKETKTKQPSWILGFCDVMYCGESHLLMSESSGRGGFNGRPFMVQWPTRLSDNCERWRPRPLSPNNYVITGSHGRASPVNGDDPSSTKMVKFNHLPKPQLWINSYEILLGWLRHAFKLNRQLIQRYFTVTAPVVWWREMHVSSGPWIRHW